MNREKRMSLKTKVTKGPNLFKSWVFLIFFSPDMCFVCSPGFISHLGNDCCGPTPFTNGTTGMQSARKWGKHQSNCYQCFLGQTPVDGIYIYNYIYRDILCAYIYWYILYICIYHNIIIMYIYISFKHI
jgi:hypothetical protein